MTERPPGRVFTPPALAAAMWRLALRHATPRAGVLAGVEPSAGDGALLRAGFDAATAAGLRLDLDAVELDPASVEALRALDPGAHGLRVVHADALSLVPPGSTALPAEPPPPTAAGTRFGATPPASLLGDRLLDAGWADVVVANPPYLRETGNAEAFRALRTWFDGYDADWYRKDTDLHVFFWRRAMRWLRPGGVLVFLTPAYAYEAASARPLRAALAAEGRVLGVWRAEGDAAFAGIGVQAAVTVWRRGETAPSAPRLDDALEPTAATVRIPRDGGPWWVDDADPTALDALAAGAARLDALYRIVEGVSTGANRLTARSAGLVPGGSVGDGVLLLRREERAALGLLDAPQVVRRWSASGRDEYVVRVRDGELPRLDAGDAPATPLERHLLRMRPVLEARAEMRRNPARSWYATAWPRSELDAPGCIVTPKWAPAPAFEALDGARVPMTDCRVLVPRTDEVADARAAVLSWLHGTALAPWIGRRLKRKGALAEFYGEAFAALPVPRAVVGV